MKAFPMTRVATAAAALLLSSLPLLAQAQDKDPTKEFVQKVNNATGLEFWGYARSGFLQRPEGTGPPARQTIRWAANLQKYRLGNEGDHYIEFGIGKRFDLGDGMKWGVFYMPNIYNGDTGTAQAYATMTGIFGNNITLWAGQRFHRIQDVHIVDNWVMEDGDKLRCRCGRHPAGRPGHSLNVALYNSDSFGNKAGNPNNAHRMNLQWRKIPTNPGGTISLTAGIISGDFARAAMAAPSASCTTRRTSWSRA